MTLATGNYFFVHTLTHLILNELRLEEEDEEISKISLEDLTKVTTTTKPNSYWWIENGVSLTGSKL